MKPWEKKYQQDDEAETAKGDSEVMPPWERQWKDREPEKLRVIKSKLAESVASKSTPEKDILDAAKLITAAIEKIKPEAAPDLTPMFAEIREALKALLKPKPRVKYIATVTEHDENGRVLQVEIEPTRMN